jgi:hypothetical protein
MPLATYSKNIESNKFDVYYGQRLFKRNLSFGEAKLVADSLNEIQTEVAVGSIWNIEKVQQIGLKNRYVITEEQAVKIIKYLNSWQVQHPGITLDDYQVARGIRYWFISKTDLQMRQIWIYFQNQQLDNRHLIEPLFDWPANTPVEVFLTWYSGEFQMDVVKLMEGKSFEESKLEYESD